jgi:hypothetical protein
MFDIAFLDAGPISPCQPSKPLPRSTVENLVDVEMGRLRPFVLLGTLTTMQIRDSLLMVANIAQAVCK